MPPRSRRVLVQTYTDFELLIWDDGSTDRSVEIANHYTTFDKRIRVVAAPHTGVGQTFKNALAQTTGKYLGWVDSDDMLSPTALEETIAILDSQPSVGMVYTDHLITDEIGNIKGIGNRCRIPYSKERLLIDFMTFHFRLMRREVYDRVGGIREELESAEDYDLCLRLSFVTEIYHLAKPLYLYRVHGDSVTKSPTLKQAYCSSLAVKDALVRRGMDSDYELGVMMQYKFFLKPSKQEIQFATKEI